MQPIDKTDSDRRPHVTEDYAIPVQTGLGLIFLIFSKSAPDFLHATGNISTRKISSLLDKDIENFLEVLSLEEACIVNHCWDSYIEHLAKEAEISKASDLKYHLRKALTEKQELAKQIEKKELRCQGLRSR